MTHRVQLWSVLDHILSQWGGIFSIFYMYSNLKPFYRLDSCYFSGAIVQAFVNEIKDNVAYIVLRLQWYAFENLFFYVNLSCWMLCYPYFIYMILYAKSYQFIDRKHAFHALFFIRFTWNCLFSFDEWIQFNSHSDSISVHSIHNEKLSMLLILPTWPHAYLCNLAFKIWPKP